MRTWAPVRRLIRSRHFILRPAAGSVGASRRPRVRRPLGWPAIARGDSTLILAPTGSGKTLDGVSVVPGSADVHARRRPKRGRCRVLYVSPLKALAVDVERNLRAPLAGIAQVADGTRRRLHRAGDRDPHRATRRSPSARGFSASRPTS